MLGWRRTIAAIATARAWPCHVPAVAALAVIAASPAAAMLPTPGLAIICTASGEKLIAVPPGQPLPPVPPGRHGAPLCAHGACLREQALDEDE